MNHASLFSGIGGFDLAAEWAGWNNVFHCEWNPFGQQVLNYHFPNSISYNDITKTDFTVHANKIDILTGGFPCQPYSSAGKRLGKADERHLFPEMLRTIKEVRPRWVIGENVRGLVSWNGGLVFDEVCADLESEGYEIQPFLIPASGVNAPHQRQRIWFVAFNASNTISFRRGENVRVANGKSNVFDENGEARDFANTFGIRLEHGTETGQIQRTSRFSETERGQSSLSIETNGNGYKPKWQNFPTQSPICRGNDGLSGTLDGIAFSKWRKESIKAYGNAIVPQVAFEIFKTINTFEEQLKNL